MSARFPLLLQPMDPKRKPPPDIVYHLALIDHTPIFWVRAAGKAMLNNDQIAQVTCAESPPCFIAVIKQRLQRKSS